MSYDKKGCNKFKMRILNVRVIVGIDSYDERRNLKKSLMSEKSE